MEFISKLSGASSGSPLTTENVSSLENLFRQYVGDNQEIRKADFSRIIQTKNQFFTDRVFDIFDRDGSGSISLEEFLDAMHRFTGENPEDKIKFLFRVYDVDGNGLIQDFELEQVMRACMEENGMKFSDQQIRELTTALFEDADVERHGALTYEALKGQLEKHPGLLENLSISIERWLVPAKQGDPPKSLRFLSLPHQFSINYLKNNYVYVLWLLAFLATNLILFVTRALSYRGNPSAKLPLIMAKSAGQCLNFNCTFILVVMLRRSLTFLRARGASAFLPIDQHIYFHKVTGWFIFVFSIFHTVMHLWNIEVSLLQNSSFNNTGNWNYAEILFNPKATMALNLGLIHGYAYLSGVILMLILVVMVVCSMPFVRRGGCFEIFYWTHLLYIFFWLLLIIHAPNFWKWFIAPGIIFLVEQALRVYHLKIGSGKMHISAGVLLPSKVTHLVIQRPPDFDFNPGDYVFVRIPEIAKYEWHPFTISSGPEQTDAVWLHIRAVGEWTKRLYDYFEQEQKNICTGIIDSRAQTDTVAKYETSRWKSIWKKSVSRIITERGHDLVDQSSYENEDRIPLLGKQKKQANSKYVGAAIEDSRTTTFYGLTTSLISRSKHTVVGIGKPLEIYVDGPFGTPSGHIFRTQHAVLIATGIGVTPFASILQSIMRQYWASRNTCPNCQCTWCSQLPLSVLNLKKVDFFWINRDQRSFEWFVQLLSELEIEQAELGGAMERFLDMHMYITSALQRTDMKAVGLQLALDLLHEKEKRDLITGLKTRTNAGRPDWNKIFQQLKDQRKGKVTVFYCGPPALARTLKLQCDEFGFTFRKELF